MTASTQEIADRVIQVIAKTQHLQPESFTVDSTFEEMKIDSLDGINIVFAVENEFGINVPDEAMKQLRSVRDVINGVEALLAAKASGGAAAVAS